MFKKYLERKFCAKNNDFVQKMIKTPMNEKKKEVLNRLGHSLKNIMLNNRLLNDVLYWMILLAFTFGIAIFFYVPIIKWVGYISMALGVFIFVIWIIYKVVQNG